MEQHVRVLIADDQEYIRKGLQALLAAWPDIEVAGIGTSGTEVVQMAGQCQPDVILMDIQKPRLNLNRTDGLAGLEAIRHIRSRWPKVRLVVLTMYTTHRAAALAAGADVFLLKGCTAEAIREALLQPRPTATKPGMLMARASRPLPALS